MAKTQFDEMYDRLPSTIKESDVLRDDSKKLLAALLDLLLHSEAKDTGIIIAPNRLLMRMSGVGSDAFASSIFQLEDYGLIERESGSRRKKGEKAKASQYTVNIDNLTKPIIEKTFDDLFGHFITANSPQTPMSAAIETAIPIITETGSKMKTETEISTGNEIEIKIGTGIETETKNEIESETKASIDCTVASCTLPPKELFKGIELGFLTDKKHWLTREEYSTVKHYVHG